MNHPIHEARVLVSSDNDSDRFLPEGPRCIAIDGREALIWVNIQTGTDATGGTIFYRFWDSTELHRLPQTGRPGFVFPTNLPGCVVVGRDKEVGLLDLKSNFWTRWASIDDLDPRTMINDGEIVPGGRAIVFGTKDVKFADPIANLYLFTIEDRQITKLADRQLCSNGKVFASIAEEFVLYDIDTPKRNVVEYRLNVERRSLSAGSVILDLAQIEGFPDGMVDGGDGSLIIAFYNPAQVESGRAYRFQLTTGKIVEEWTTFGSPRVTCPMLCKRDGRIQLVLTTAVEGMPPEMRQHAPNAGNLFIADTDLTELPPGETVRI